MSEYAALGKAQRALLRMISDSKVPVKVSDERAANRLYSKGLIQFVTISGIKHYSATTSGKAASRKI
jgi:hypothetical protein